MQAEVLAALRRRRGPLSAYDVLGKLSAANPKIAPATIYRALSALTERGRVHLLKDQIEFADLVILNKVADALPDLPDPFPVWRRAQAAA